MMKKIISVCMLMLLCSGIVFCAAEEPNVVNHVESLKELSAKSFAKFFIDKGEFHNHDALIDCLQTIEDGGDEASRKALLSFLPQTFDFFNKSQKTISLGHDYAAGSDYTVTCLSIIDNDRLVIGTLNRVLILDFQGCSISDISGDVGPVNCVTKITENKIAVGLANGRVLFYDLRRFALERSINAHRSAVTSIEKINDTSIVVGSAHGTISVWNSITGQNLIAFLDVNYIKSLGVLPDGKVASGHQDGSVRIWDFNRAQNHCRVTLGPGERRPIKFLKILVNGDIVIAFDNVIKVLFLSGGEYFYKNTLLCDQSVTCLDLLPDGKIIYGVGDRLYGWNLVTNQSELISKSLNPGQEIRSIQILPNGKIFTAGDDHNLVVIDSYLIKEKLKEKGLRAAVGYYHAMQHDSVHETFFGAGPVERIIRESFLVEDQESNQMIDYFSEGGLYGGYAEPERRCCWFF